MKDRMSLERVRLLDNIKICDTVIEVIDARIPFTSRNKKVDKFLQYKNRIIVINKSDLVTKEFAESLEKHYKKTKTKYTLSLSAKTGQNMKRLFYILKEVFDRKKIKLERKGAKAFPIRVIVIGIPNVGKSKIINSLIGKKIAGVGNRPGFTRGKQWIKILPDVDLLDTPGVLWAEDTENSLLKQSIIGSIKDSSELIEKACLHFLNIVSASVIEKAYNIKFINKEPANIVYDLSAHLKMDEFNVSQKIIKDYREGKLGPIFLEAP